MNVLAIITGGLLIVAGVSTGLWLPFPVSLPVAFVLFLIAGATIATGVN